ncbi:hypothetical protein SLNWT_2853 [Streptomyces albus]|uniref:Uncharacterized protein n=1 Tax=Streptomyces albus (strain ATCC 21838 / DSM 41398 / FERM P-419 / JCM 4703 / NBRC 107858) TaxID=1081613 RepID=A0A0B5ENN7_STRA4|nr:hypothetical protein SLNWT_2853 [Streptomyces albus]AOU77542.1 hypothetical protein SLNHY_2851 [Streptomyces albus]
MVRGDGSPPQVSVVRAPASSGCRAHLLPPRSWTVTYAS